MERLRKFEAEFGGQPGVMDAYRFARDAHGLTLQVRDYTGDPYIVHPVEVACNVAAVPHSLAMLMGALLHDVCEDTPVSLEDIQARFGGRVADLVQWLTKTPAEAGVSRKERVRVECERLAQAPGSVHTIKIADILDNCSTLPRLDPRRAERYLPEKLDLLGVLVRGDAGLRQRAIDTLSAGLVEAKRATTAISDRDNPSVAAGRSPGHLDQ